MRPGRRRTGEAGGLGRGYPRRCVFWKRSTFPGKTHLGNGSRSLPHLLHTPQRGPCSRVAIPSLPRPTESINTPLVGVLTLVKNRQLSGRRPAGQPNENGVFYVKFPQKEMLAVKPTDNAVYPCTHNGFSPLPFNSPSHYPISLPKTILHAKRLTPLEQDINIGPKFGDTAK